MRAIPITPALVRVAERTVWFKPPSAALADGFHFVAHVLTYGVHDDVEELRRHLSDADLREALAHAPAGVFDRRSWAYWNAKLGNTPVPAPPQRVIPG